MDEMDEDEGLFGLGGMSELFNKMFGKKLEYEKIGELDTKEQEDINHIRAMEAELKAGIAKLQRRSLDYEARRHIFYSDLRKKYKVEDCDLKVDGNDIKKSKPQEKDPLPGV